MDAALDMGQLKAFKECFHLFFTKLLWNALETSFTMEKIKITAAGDELEAFVFAGKIQSASFCAKVKINFKSISGARGIINLP